MRPTNAISGRGSPSPFSGPAVHSVVAGAPPAPPEEFDSFLSTGGAPPAPPEEFDSPLSTGGAPPAPPEEYDSSFSTGGAPPAPPEEFDSPLSTRGAPPAPPEEFGSPLSTGGAPPAPPEEDVHFTLRFIHIWLPRIERIKDRIELILKVNPTSALHHVR
ncbi:hypothetical protein E2C01_027403 [Portunus trituberculatus]|uniref:Uncharacterized protein n=1 Tax=Portunus trituberculatus TaxID=210409 RepID=A0A5B7EHT4_PORTR|nr:hypothetical protein [Portunus trituberculatus]